MRTEVQEMCRRFSVRLFDLTMDYKLTDNEVKLIEEIRDYFHEVEELENLKRRINENRWKIFRFGLWGITYPS